MRGLMWFREDLRVEDNSALYSACQECRQSVFAFYLFDLDAWRAHDVAHCRIEFILRNLTELQKSLAKHHIPLFIFSIAESKNIPKFIVELAEILQCEKLFFNAQYEFDEERRDRAVVNLFESYGKTVLQFTDQVIFGPGEILTHSGYPYTVFTPYKKAFIAEWVKRRGVLPLPKLKSHFSNISQQSVWPMQWQQQGINFYPHVPKKLPGIASEIPADYWPGGEKVAHSRLQQFIETKIIHYRQTRDFPAMQGTSIISPYLANGVLSSRQCFAAALAANHHHLDYGQADILCWLSELIWREFYKQILWAFPRVSKNQPFKAETAQIKWNQDLEIFQAWCKGQTGYPIVDAAMRQLNQTGWMHNRLRMIVAMFLTKDCFLPWWWGEKYFMQHLVDGDLAANNGGWQWSASTGTDAAPYFRIFNPCLQSAKFDPEGEFIYRYCPELTKVPLKILHDPWLWPVNLRAQLNYPFPIIDRHQSKERVLAAFKQLVKK